MEPVPLGELKLVTSFQYFGYGSVQSGSLYSAALVVSSSSSGVCNSLNASIMLA